MTNSTTAITATPWPDESSLQKFANSPCQKSLVYIPLLCTDI